MTEESSLNILSQIKQVTADGKPIEIRPNYYNTSPLPKYQSVLVAVGYYDDLFSIECVDAWTRLRHQLCAPLTHAVKYLWRAGKKGEAEQQDVVKARFWLAQTLEMVQAMQLTSVEPETTLRWILPTPRMVLDALELLDGLILEGDHDE